MPICCGQGLGVGVMSSLKFFKLSPIEGTYPQLFTGYPQKSG